MIEIFPHIGNITFVQRHEVVVVQKELENYESGQSKGILQRPSSIRSVRFYSITDPFLGSPR
jgi:hypothetical protein